MSASVVLIGILIGFLAGGVGGLLGVGGGVVMVPAFIRFLGLSAREAVGTSIAVIVVISLSATLKHHQQGHTHWGVVALVAASSMVGAWIGAGYAAQVPEKTLRLAFAAFLFAVAANMAVRAWRL